VKGVCHFKAPRKTKRLMVVPEGAPKWDASVGSAWRNPDMREVGFAPNSTVGHAIKRYTTREAEVLRSMGFCEPSYDMNYYLLGHCLQRTSQVPMPIS